MKYQLLVAGLIAMVMAYSCITTSGAVMRKECMNRSSAVSLVRKESTR